MKEHIIDFFSALPDQLATFFVAMIPITELRASIPFAILKLHMSPLEAFLYSVLGNVVAGIVVIVFVENVLDFLLERIGPLKRFWEKYIHRIYTKNKDKFEKWGAVTLVTFVAIPLPLTGIVTGAVAASIFQIPFKKALPLLALGSMIAGVIVTLLTIGTDFLI